uniref:Protein kinase domain-containing protein n=1 Tax=Maylandia zebra TaxID=106582 RepID=A0A3P9B4R3_9CICH
QSGDGLHAISGHTWSIDMWSLGLVAVELATGLPLYPGNEDYDVLKFIIETQGQPPDHFIISSSASLFFNYLSVAMLGISKPTSSASIFNQFLYFH